MVLCFRPQGFSELVIFWRMLVSRDVTIEQHFVNIPFTCALNYSQLEKLETAWIIRIVVEKEFPKLSK